MKFFQGHTVYSPMVLTLYDFFVLGFSNKFIWKCPTKKLLALYERNVSENHLDIGVGSGYYMSAAQFPVLNPQITLLDLNENCLNEAAQRIQNLMPKKVISNILKDPPLEQTFSSVSLCYLLHCLSGGLEEKCKVFDKVSCVLKRGGRVFGATIIPSMPNGSYASEALMTFYNKIGVFSNKEDTMEGIAREFRKRFEEHHIQSCGSVLLFEGKAR